MKKISIDVEQRMIEDLIPELESGKFYLPSFQRRWIWDEDDIKTLFDSIINSLPIGVIILWKPSIVSPDKTDPFSIPLINVERKESNEMFYVIDGQQRLTSLLLLFNNWKFQRAKEFIECKIPIAYNPSNNKIYKSKTRGFDLFELTKAYWQNDIAILNKLEKEAPRKHQVDMKDKIYRILKYKIPIYKMATNEENEETFADMAEAFIRVNKYGVRIGNLELMLSFLAGSISGDIKKNIYDLYEPCEKEFGIDLHPIIRFAFSNFALRQTQISKVKQFKSNIEIIKKVQKEEKDCIFARSKTAINLSIQFIKNRTGINNSGLLPSQIPILIIASYFYHSKIENIDQLNQETSKKIINWFVLVNFNGFYSSSTDTKIDEDLGVINSNEEFPFELLIENMKKKKAKIKITNSDIRRGLKSNVLRREGRAYLFFLYLLLVKQKSDNWNGRLLSQSPLNEIARHHIYPKDFLENKLDIEDPDEKEIEINNLGNITFIHKDINSEIGEEPPESYMNKYIESAKKHFISSDEALWKYSKYREHLEYRVNEICRVGKVLFKEIYE